MNLIEIYKLGKRIYNTSNWRELHRFVVFLVRSILHLSDCQKLYAWFLEDDNRKKMLNRNPFFMEQATREFFYSGATFEERAALIRNHIAMLQRKFKPDWAYRVALYEDSYRIWTSGEKDIDWYAQLSMEPGLRKEGMLAIKMMLNGRALYQIVFWLNKNKDNEDALWIGAMQGPNSEDAKDLIKDITKRSHRYRTKNLILYMTMAVARSLGCRHIYAVSNEGYYAMNHVRRDRKLKTDFGLFWEETGGHVTEDSRFFEVPLEESRKTMEEVPTRKRAVYRKRFAFQDDVDVQISANMGELLR